jgi:hypothetical protein
LHVTYCCSIAQAYGVEFIDSSGCDVGMSIDQPWGRGSSLQIDHVGFGPGKGLDLQVGTDGDDLSLANGDRLGNGVLGVDGQDLAVDKDQIGR